MDPGPLSHGGQLWTLNPEVSTVEIVGHVLHPKPQNLLNAKDIPNPKP